GLGHGELASEAAQKAEQIIDESSSWSLVPLLENCHRGLVKTRGAAIAIAVVDQGKGILRFAGVGNIAGDIVSPTSSHGLASHNGTLGAEMPRAQEFTYPWSPSSLLVMHSDGLQ